MLTPNGVLAICFNWIADIDLGHPEANAIVCKEVRNYLPFLLPPWRWGHRGRVVTLSPPTSAAGVRSPSWP